MKVRMLRDNDIDTWWSSTRAGGEWRAGRRAHVVVWLDQWLAICGYEETKMNGRHLHREANRRFDSEHGRHFTKKGRHLRADQKTSTGVHESNNAKPNMLC